MADFTIYYDAYLRTSQARKMKGLRVDNTLLKVLLDLHPTEKGWPVYGEVEISIEELWKRRMLDVPINLTGTSIKIVYDYDHDVRAAML